MVYNIILSPAEFGPTVRKPNLDASFWHAYKSRQLFAKLGVGIVTFLKF